LATALQAELLERHAQESSLANQTRAAIASATAALASWQAVGNVEAQSRVLSLLSQEYRNVGDKAGADKCVARMHSERCGKFGRQDLLLKVIAVNCFHAAIEPRT
jgi:hypothetical protein